MINKGLKPEIGRSGMRILRAPWIPFGNQVACSALLQTVCLDNNATICTTILRNV
jgi:hypothetical protein